MRKQLLLLALLLLAFPISISGSSGEEGNHGHVCFSQIDTDRNQVVSPEEFAVAYTTPDSARRFAAIDSDGNGTLDHEEYHTALGGAL